MTKENFTSINVIIDRSGSMASLTNDTIGGFNKFLEEQKACPGEAAFTLITFNTNYDVVHDFVKVAEVPGLTVKSYRPGGGTALLDALGTAINKVGQRLSDMPEEERPSKVLFLIVTDGAENSSREFNKGQIKEMISHQQDKYSWDFIFMGANIDSITEGAALGIAMKNTLDYAPTSVGTKNLYKSVSQNTTRYRSTLGKVDFFDTTPSSGSDKK